MTRRTYRDRPSPGRRRTMALRLSGPGPGRHVAAPPGRRPLAPRRALSQACSGGHGQCSPQAGPRAAGAAAATHWQLDLITVTQSLRRWRLALNIITAGYLDHGS